MTGLLKWYRDRTDASVMVSLHEHHVPRVIGRAALRPRRRAGLTLIECVFAMVIVPMAVAAIALAVVSGQGQALAALRNTRAAALAESLMDEVTALPYADPSGASALGPEAGETSRSLFDNIDDYHGYSEAAGSLADRTGTLYGSEYQGFSRQVTCAASTQTVAGFGSVVGISITVTVTQGTETALSITRFVREPPE